MLGQLGYVRTKDAGKFKFSPNAEPVVFVGWRLDFGMRYRGVLQFVVYSHLREDASSYPLSQFHDTEVYMPEDATFPLASAAEAALKELDDPRLTELHDIDAVPVPFVDSEIEPKTRRVYVTYARMLKIGATKGCKGCENDTSSHNQACIERFEEAFGRKDADGSFIEPEVPVSSDVPAIEPMHIRDEASDGGFAEESVPECPPSDLDEPYEAESPIKTPPHAAFHELDTDDEADDKSPVTGLGAVASIAFDAAASLPQEDVQSMFQGSFDQGGQTGCLGAAAAPEKKPPKHGKGKHNCPGKDVLFECACAKDSNLGKVGHENGLGVIRLCTEDINLEDPHSIEQLIAQVDALKGCSLHGSIECRPWSQWQHLSRAKYPRLAAKIEQEQVESAAALVEQFIRVANVCLDNGGDCSFELPRFCTGWALPSIQSWILDRNLRSATFSGCTVGVQADDQPAKKPWRFITSSLRLAKNLASLNCTHSTHAPLQGKWARLSAFYPDPLCNIRIQSLFPHVINQDVCSMPCVARDHQSHRQKLVPGYS